MGQAIATDRTPADDLELFLNELNDELEKLGDLVLELDLTLDLEDLNHDIEKLGDLVLELEVEVGNADDSEGQEQEDAEEESEEIQEEVDEAEEEEEQEPSESIGRVKKGVPEEESTQLSERVGIVLAGLDKAELRLFGKDRRYVRGGWHMPTRSRKTVRKDNVTTTVTLKNKYYKTAVKITNWLFNRCSGTGNSLQIVATDYGCAVAKSLGRQLDLPPYFITGYSPTERNKRVFNKFTMEYQQSEGVSYWKPRPKVWSIVYGHVKLEEQSKREVKGLLDAKRALRQQIASGAFMDEYSCALKEVKLPS